MGGRDAHRRICHSDFLDSVRGDRGIAEAAVRARRRPLRRAAARSARAGRSGAASRRRPLPRGEPARRRGSRSRTARSSAPATAAAGSSARRRSSSGPKAIVVPGVPFEVLRSRAGDLRRSCPVRADRRRTRRLPGAAARQGRPVVPDPVGHGVDDARAHAARGRSRRARARRREPVPASLDLRQRRQPRPEERHRRLQDVVPRVARRQHAVGRRGVAGRRRGGGDRARARVVAQRPRG